MYSRYETTYYDTLEMGEEARKKEYQEKSEEEKIAIIKKQYRILAMKYHPDKNPGDKIAEENFKKIDDAYKILLDEQPCVFHVISFFPGFEIMERSLDSNKAYYIYASQHGFLYYINQNPIYKSQILVSNHGFGLQDLPQKFGIFAPQNQIELTNDNLKLILKKTGHAHCWRMKLDLDIQNKIKQVEANEQNAKKRQINGEPIQFNSTKVKVDAGMPQTPVYPFNPPFFKPDNHTNSNNAYSQETHQYNFYHWDSMATLLKTGRKRAVDKSEMKNLLPKGKNDKSLIAFCCGMALSLNGVDTRAWKNLYDAFDNGAAYDDLPEQCRNTLIPEKFRCEPLALQIFCLEKAIEFAETRTRPTLEMFLKQKQSQKSKLDQMNAQNSTSCNNNSAYQQQKHSFYAQPQEKDFDDLMKKHGLDNPLHYRCRPK